MELLIWLVLGLTAGWFVSLLMGTNNPQGMMTDVVLGMIGAIVGGLVLNILGQPGISGFNGYSVAIASLGAIVLIWLGKVISAPAK